MTLQRRTERSVDWAALRRRLDEAHAALERTDQPNADATRSILERRAARLAEPIVTDEKGDTYQVITFRLGSETCAIDARFVLNVFRLRGLALLPGAPTAVHGLTMWKGEVLTLIDLRPLLGLPTAALTDLGRVVVLGRGRAAFGFLADSVSGIRGIRRDEVHESHGESGGRNVLVTGITSDALLVLDGEQVLNIANTGA